MILPEGYTEVSSKVLSLTRLRRLTYGHHWGCDKSVGHTGGVDITAHNHVLVINSRGARSIRARGINRYEGVNLANDTMVGTLVFTFTNWVRTRASTKVRNCSALSVGRNEKI